MADPSVYLKSLFSLQGKTALVTGGTRGLGRGLAVALASAGADLVLLHRGPQTEPNLQTTLALLRPLNRRILLYHCNLLDRSYVSTIINQICVEDGINIDIFVHCAGLQHRAPAEEFPEEMWDRIMEVNLRAGWVLAKGLAKVWLGGEKGVAKLRGNPNRASMSGGNANRLSGMAAAAANASSTNANPPPAPPSSNASSAAGTATTAATAVDHKNPIINGIGNGNGMPNGNGTGAPRHSLTSHRLPSLTTNGHSHNHNNSHNNAHNNRSDTHNHSHVPPTPSSTTTAAGANNNIHPPLPPSRKKIVFIASVLSTFGSANVPAYVSSKGGVAQLTKALSNEWAPRGICVNALAPGYFETDLTEQLRGEGQEGEERRLLERVPVGRWGVAGGLEWRKIGEGGEETTARVRVLGDLEAGIVYLCGRGSDFVTGEIHYVDGGFCAR